MMKENNDIFFAASDALVYLVIPMHQKYSTTFAWGHPFSTYVSSTPCLHCKHMYVFRVTVSAAGLFQKKPFKRNRTYILKNMLQNQISTNK